MDVNDIPVQAALQWLRDEHALYVRLEAAARRQRELVMQEDAAGLLKLLTSKQTVTDELTRLSRRLTPVRRNWCTLRKRLSDAEREEADALIAASTDLLDRIVRQDEEDARRIAVMRQATSRELSDVTQTRRAIGGYATAGRVADTEEKGWRG